MDYIWQQVQGGKVVCEDRSLLFLYFILFFVNLSFISFFFLVLLKIVEEMGMDFCIFLEKVSNLVKFILGMLL